MCCTADALQMHKDNSCSALLQGRQEPGRVGFEGGEHMGY